MQSVDESVNGFRRLTPAGWNVGLRLGERYRLEELLACGTFGDVYRAEHLELRAEVAIKILRDTGNQDDGVSLRREAEALWRIRHPNILRATDYGIVDGTHFMVTELVRGRTLESVLLDHPRPPEMFSAQLMRQLLSALDAVHAAGIAHEDVSPRNCICAGWASISDAPDLRLIDFGSSRPVRRVVNSESRARPCPSGTPGYSAPQQSPTPAGDVRRDLYSAGAIAYQLWTGAAPFGVAAPTEILRRQREGRPLPPAEPIDPGVLQVIVRALSPNLADGYASAHEFWRALKGALTAAHALALGVPQAASGSNSMPGAAADPRDAEPLKRLLSTVREVWVDGMLQSHRGALTTVPQRKTIRFAHSTLAALEADEAQTEEELDESAPLGELLARVNGGLLIVGEPGHGKTLALLRLLRTACDRAVGLARPVPVLFNLSNWRPGRGPLIDWMAGELSVKYLVHRAQAHRWLAQRKLSVFLDGLNEVPPGSVQECVQTINRFVTACAPPALVVSCRLNEYQSCPEKLNLGGLLTLHPLKAETVLAHTRGGPWTPLRAALDASPGLTEMLRVPLFLQLACKLGADSRLFDTMDDDPGRRVLEAYVQRTQSAVSRDPREGRALSRVVERLATCLVEEGRTVFHFEDLQPRWLKRASSRLAYALGTRLLVALLFGLSTVLAVGLSPLDNGGLSTGIGFGLRLGLVGALVLGVGYSALNLLDNGKIQWSRGLPSRRTPGVNLLFSVGLGMVVGSLLYVVTPHPVVFVLGVQVTLVGGFVLGTSRTKRRLLDSDIQVIDSVHFRPLRMPNRHKLKLVCTSVVGGAALAVAEDLQSGADFALLIFVVGTLLLGYEKGENECRPSQNVGIHQSLAHALQLGTLAFASVSLIFGLSYGWTYGACVGLSAAVVAALCFGGVDVLNHYVLRAMLAREGRLDLSAHRWLERATKSGMLSRVGGGYMFEHPMLLDHYARQHFR